MLAEIILTALAVILFFVGIAILSRNLPENRRVLLYWKRPCAGRAWRTAFPDAPKQDIRRFLHCFACDAFLFPKRIALHFRPEDRIMDVYRAIYPPTKWRLFVADSMELESFASCLEHDFGLSANAIATCSRDDVTLGEVFRLLQQAKAMQNEQE